MFIQERLYLVSVVRSSDTVQDLIVFRQARVGKIIVQESSGLALK
jgi:hypothetical protein